VVLGGIGGGGGVTTGVVRAAAPNNERGGIPRLGRRLGFSPETANVEGPRNAFKGGRGRGEGVPEI
jgi:hypothetical protein